MNQSRLFFAALMAILMLVGLAYADNAAQHPRALTGDEPVTNVAPAPVMPGLITDSPGTTIGTTQYDYQTNGSTGNRVVIDVTGGKHFSWMNATTYPSPRHIYYNYEDPAGNWLAPNVGVQVNDGAGAGYTTLSEFSDNRALVAYHQVSLRDITAAIQSAPGVGSFAYFSPPDSLVQPLRWPYVTIDRKDRIHIVASEQLAPFEFGYTNSSDGGATWSTLATVDTTVNVSAIVVSSLVSDKVAIVYTRSIDGTNNNCNVFYVLSTDGTTWDFVHGKVNLTNYSGVGQRAYDDLDAVFDYNDNLQILWNSALYTAGIISIPYQINHYNGSSGQINTVTTENYALDCNVGVWNYPLGKMSIGNGPNDALFATWTRFDTADAASDGYCNGELYMSYTADGSTWATPADMTNSHTPGCTAGNCDSDHWSSLAEQVDANLHIVYINDKFAGGVPQNEGTATTNPVLYLEYPNPIFSGSNAQIEVTPQPLELTLQPDQIGTADLSVSDDGQTPLQFAMSETTSWLSIPYVRGAVKEGVGPTIPVTFNSTGLSNGVYNGQIFFRTNDPSFPALTINAILTVTTPGCAYTPGDINGNHSVNGVDIVYAVNYLKGGPAPPVDCYPACPLTPNPFYAAGDVNGNCAFNGIDVTFFVRYLKGQVPSLLSCPDCPPAR
jgi:hypothetical protein